MDTHAWLSTSFCYVMATALSTLETIVYMQLWLHALAFFLNSGQGEACYMQY